MVTLTEGSHSLREEASCWLLLDLRLRTVTRLHGAACNDAVSTRGGATLLLTPGTLSAHFNTHSSGVMDSELNSHVWQGKKINILIDH